MYLDGFTIPLTEWSILTTLFLDGKILSSSRIPYSSKEFISTITKAALTEEFICSTISRQSKVPLLCS